MTTSSDTFPFGIADVVELLGLTVRRRLPSSLYLPARISAPSKTY